MIVTAEEIRSIIGEADTMADMEVLQNNVSLTEQGVDSLDMANIYLLIEEKFEVKLPDEDVSQLGTVENIVNYLQNT